MKTTSSPRQQSPSTPKPFRGLPGLSDLPHGTNRRRGVEIDALWAKVIAMAARNWVEDLHVAGAFSDRQAPALNRAIRNRIYEVLKAWRRCNPKRPANRFNAYLNELTTDPDEQWPRSAVTAAVAQAVQAFSAAEGVDHATAVRLQEAASAGAQSAVEDLLDFDADAQRRIAWLVSMLPDYWEPCTVSETFRTVLENTGHPST